jgi:hypothetical protein
MTLPIFSPPSGVPAPRQGAAEMGTAIIKKDFMKKVKENRPRHGPASAAPRPGGLQSAHCPAAWKKHSTD